MASIKCRPGHKIEFELPGWARERHIYIFAGVELLAKIEGDELTFKKERCKQCGECCKHLSSNGQYAKFGFVNEKGWCKYLVENGDKFECGLGVLKPLACAIAEGVYPTCKVKHE